MSKCRAGRNLLIAGMSQLSWYLGVCQQLLQEGFCFFFPFQKKIRGRKAMVSRLAISRCMATGSTICTGQDEPEQSWELAWGCLSLSYMGQGLLHGGKGLSPGLRIRTDAWSRWSRLTPSQGLFPCLDWESLSLGALGMDWG